MAKRGFTEHGFTLIEVLVTMVLVSVAVVGVLGGIRAVQRAGARAESAALMQTLVSEKLGDITLLADPDADGRAGDFGDRGHPDISWTEDIETTGAANVDKVTVTATQNGRSQAISTLLFVRPSSGTSPGGTALGGSGRR